MHFDPLSRVGGPTGDSPPAKKIQKMGEGSCNKIIESFFTFSLCFPCFFVSLRYDNK